jgi:hypothetical protein
MPPLLCRTPHDWSRYSLEQIWGMVGRQSSVTGQVSADLWASILTLCREKAFRIEQALEKLRVYWPETQEAARMFQAWGASLVSALQCTAETARLNLQVVLNIKEELASARGRVSALMELRNEYQAEEQARQAMAMEYFAPLDWRPELERQACEVMADLENKIYTYALELYADPPFRPPLSVPVDATDGEAIDGSTAGPTAPYAGGSVFTPPTWLPPRWETDVDPLLPADPGSGSAPGSGGATVPGGAPGPGGAPISDGDTALGGGIGGPGGGGGPGHVPGVVGPGGVFVETPGGRVVGPGGVIGGPGAGQGATPGGPAAPGIAGGPLVAPGVGAAGRPPGPGMVPFVPPMMGQPGSRGTTGASGSRRGQRQGLPSVFQVPEAPPAVIQAPEEPEHDPGPGVIGIDR